MCCRCCCRCLRGSGWSELIAALQAVIDRHDVLRTAVLWEQLPRPVQVVYRQARLPVEEIALDPARDALRADQASGWSRERQRLDLRQAPLMRLQVAADPHSEQWYALLQLHHIGRSITCRCEMPDRGSRGASGRASTSSCRSRCRIAIMWRRRWRMRSSTMRKAFFRGKLADVDEPTAPFGLLDVHGDGSQIDEAQRAARS